MFPFSARLFRPTLAGVILLLMLATTPSVVTASLTKSASHVSITLSGDNSSVPHHASAVVHLDLPHDNTTHFLYVDNGLAPDSISGYQITSNGLVPTPSSPYPTGGASYLDTFGENFIATSAANGLCLFHTDFTGRFESFTINSSTGALTEVSMVALGGASLQQVAGDIQVASSGLYVYVSLWGPPSYINVLTVSSGCSVKLANTLDVPQSSYVSIALIDNNSLLAVDKQNGRIDVYSITNGTQLALVSSTPSQLYRPIGAASFANPSPKTWIAFTTGEDGVEAYITNGKQPPNPMTGSPAEDPCYCNDSNVLVDAPHQQLVVTEQTSLGIFGVIGNTFTFLSQAPLASGDYGPSAMVELGSEVYVVNSLSSTVDACLMATGSASCSLIATLPTGGFPQGIGVL